MVVYDWLSTLRVAYVVPSSTAAFAKVKVEGRQNESKETATLARDVAEPL